MLEIELLRNALQRLAMKQYRSSSLEKAAYCPSLIREKKENLDSRRDGSQKLLSKLGILVHSNYAAYHVKS